MKMWHESHLKHCSAFFCPSKCIFRKQKIILSIKTPLTASLTLARALGASKVCTERRPACCSYRTFLTSAAAPFPILPLSFLPPPPPSPRRRLSSPCAGPGGDGAIFGGCTRRKTTHSRPVCSPACVSSTLLNLFLGNPIANNRVWRIYCQRGLCPVQI